MCSARITCAKANAAVELGRIAEAVELASGGRHQSAAAAPRLGHSSGPEDRPERTGGLVG